MLSRYDTLLSRQFSGDVLGSHRAFFLLIELMKGMGVTLLYMFKPKATLNLPRYRSGAAGRRSHHTLRYRHDQAHLLRLVRRSWSGGRHSRRPEHGICD